MTISDGEGRLTTHVLDTANGCPANGILIELYALEGEKRTHISSVTTNSDGRTDGPLMTGSNMKTGVYEAVFHAGNYFELNGAAEQGLPFLSSIPIRFGIADANLHYHVPLLVSRYSYSTYRGG